MIAVIVFKRIAWVVVGGLVAVAGLGAANMAGFNPFQLVHSDRSQPAVLMSIQKLSRYHAAVGNFEQVLDIPGDVSWLPLMSRRAASTPTSICPASRART
jgi:hypothetical protein